MCVAKESHIALLERSVASFNEYRTDNPEEQIDLRGAIFHDNDFPDVDLHGADLSGSSWRGVNLAGANLTDVQADLADFEGAILTGAHVWRAKFLNANLAHADMRDILGLETADLTGTEYAR